MAQRADHQYEPRIAVAMGRKYRGQSQLDLANALTLETGDDWSRGMVSHLESGRKELSVATLMAISKIQDLPYEFYLEGPERNSPMGVYLSSPVDVAA